MGAAIAREGLEEGRMPWLTVLCHGRNLGVGQEAPVKLTPFWCGYPALVRVD